jgi:hypothetical protein
VTDSSERGNLLEFLAVLLLGLATVGSAWAAFESSRWNGEESRQSRSAASDRIEASRLFTLATQAISYDASLISDYAQAVTDGRQDLVDFYRTYLVRPEFLPMLEEWTAEVQAGGTVPNIFENEEYTQPLTAPYQEADAAAADADAKAREAADNADEYLLTTLFMASALFFAGVTSSFQARGSRLVLLAASGLALAIGVSRLVDLPVT